MDENIIISLIGITIIIGMSLIFIVAGWKPMSSIFLSILLSNIIVFIYHPIHIKSGIIEYEYGNEAIYIFWTCTTIYSIIFLFIQAYENITNRCIIKCCRPSNYDHYNILNNYGRYTRTCNIYSYTIDCHENI